MTCYDYCTDFNRSRNKRFVEELDNEDNENTDLSIKEKLNIRGEKNIVA